MSTDQPAHNCAIGEAPVPPMKALSTQQPWAWLIVHRYKPIENRSWATARRGDHLIHASKTFDQAGYDYVKAEFPEIPMPLPHEFERGGVVGRANLRDCVTASDSRWFSGPFGFVFSDATPLPFYPVRGMLGFFDCDMPAIGVTPTSRVDAQADDGRVRVLEGALQRCAQAAYWLDSDPHCRNTRCQGVRNRTHHAVLDAAVAGLGRQRAYGLIAHMGEVNAVIEAQEAERARTLGIAGIVRSLVADEITERKAVELLVALMSGADHSAPAARFDQRVDPMTEREIAEAFAPLAAGHTPETQAFEYIQNYGKDPATVRQVVVSRALTALSIAGEPADGLRLYVASKSTHGAMWRALRERGYPIISTWIDESEAGQTSDWSALWQRCLAEVVMAHALILYAEDGESLVGAFVEVGAALSVGRPVLYVGPETIARNLLRHPLVTRFDSLEAALDAALTRSDVCTADIKEAAHA